WMKDAEVSGGVYVSLLSPETVFSGRPASLQLFEHRPQCSRAESPEDYYHKRGGPARLGQCFRIRVTREFRHVLLSPFCRCGDPLRHQEHQYDHGERPEAA